MSTLAGHQPGLALPTCMRKRCAGRSVQEWSCAGKGHADGSFRTGVRLRRGGLRTTRPWACGVHACASGRVFGVSRRGGIALRLWPIGSAYKPLKFLSALVLGAPLPHLHSKWARPMPPPAETGPTFCRICTGTERTGAQAYAPAEEGGHPDIGGTYVLLIPWDPGWLDHSLLRVSMVCAR